MKLARIHGVDDVRLDDVDPPVCGPDDVIVDVAACGICGSDLGYLAMGGLTPPGVPMPIGHELVGTVGQVGANVTTVEVGQRVVVQPTGGTNGGGSDIGNGGPEGGFAPQLLVTDVVGSPNAVIPVPDSISDEHGALIEPLSVAMHGVNRSGIEPGQKAMVFGAGPIGLSTVAVLKYRGITDIAVADLSANRLDLAKQMGATVTCQVDQEDLLSVLTDAHGGDTYYYAPVVGTDVFIEATGAGPALTQAIRLAKQGATIVVVGLHKEPIQLNPLDLMMKEINLTGAMAYPDEFPAVIDMVASGTVDLEPMITHRFPLDDFVVAMKTAADTDVSAKVIITMR